MVAVSDIIEHVGGPLTSAKVASAKYGPIGGAVAGAGHAFRNQLKLLSKLHGSMSDVPVKQIAKLVNSSSKSAAQRIRGERRSVPGSARKSSRDRNVYHSRVNSITLGDRAYGPSDAIGSQACVVSGNQTFPPLQMVLGTPKTDRDSLRNMLNVMNGTGKIITQSAGSIEVPQDTRVVVCDVFRHNIGADGSNNPDDPVSMCDNYAWPGTLPLLKPLPGAVNVPGAPNCAVVASQNPFLIRTQGDVRFAPLNRSDYEDMSWNLNRLKFNTWSGGDAPLTIGTTGGTMNTSDFTAYNLGIDYGNQLSEIMATNLHRKCSAIWCNNNRDADPYDASGGRGAPFRYNMVFKSGSAKYDFQNPGTGSLEFELVVYRYKKTHIAPLTIDSYVGTQAETNLLEPLATVIGQGYLDTVQGRLGTDSVSGRKPLAGDVWDNPRHPFLPHLRKTKQGEQAMVEVSRRLVALPSGGRRTVNVQFGGDIYDPVNVAKTDATFGTANIIPNINDQTFFVMIAVKGGVATRSAVQTTTNVLPEVGVLGEMHTAACLQWQCTYTEHIGACAYKCNKAQRIYVQGASGEISSNPTGGKWVARQNIPQDHMVRTGATITTETSAGGAVAFQVNSGATSTAPAGAGGVIDINPPPL